MKRSLWGHLLLLMRSNSKEACKTGLDATNRNIVRDMLQLENDSNLDPWYRLSYQSHLVCLRILIRRFVYKNVSKDDIHKQFPTEVLPELQRLLTLLLQKFLLERQDDLLKDQVTLPQLKAMTWDMANQDAESVDPMAVINLKSHLGELDVKFQLAQDTLETMLSSMYSTRDQLSNMACVILDFLFIHSKIFFKFQSPNHDPRIYFIVRDIKLSIHQKHPFHILSGKFNLVTDWFNIVNL
ncbi:hypothetical protein ACB094_04G161400 [Castanea mollissima]